MLILSHPYQPESGQTKPINFYPLIPDSNYKIEGTHLFANHNNAVVNWNLEIRPFKTMSSNSRVKSATLVTEFMNTVSLKTNRKRTDNVLFLFTLNLQRSLEI